MQTPAGTIVTGTLRARADGALARGGLYYTRPGRGEERARAKKRMMKDLRSKIDARVSNPRQGTGPKDAPDGPPGTPTAVDSGQSAPAAPATISGDMLIKDVVGRYPALVE